MILIAAAGALLPAAANGAPFSFLLTPTDQMAVPGHAAGVEITPEGYLYTGHGEFVFRLGPRLRAFDQRIRTLEQGRYPVYISAIRHGRVTYRLTTFTAEVAGRPVAFARVTMRNRTKRAGLARWAVGVRHTGATRKPNGLYRFRFLRPASPERPGLYHQPGLPFQADAKFEFRGDALTRNDRVLYTFPSGSRGVTRSLRLRPGGARKRLRPGTVVGLSDYRARLAPGKAVSLVFRIPVTPAVAGTSDHFRIAHASYPRTHSRHIAEWRAAFERAVDIDVPEPKVEETFYASLANILMARYRDDNGSWIQTVNKLQYHAFWLRDAAVITNALDLAGLHEEARQNLPFFRTWQQDDGLFISRPGQNDGFGQALWAVGEHVRRTGDAELAREWLPSVTRAVEWFERARAADRFGLMPAGDPGDNELVAGHLAGDNFWAAAGLERAVLLARVAGEDATADRWAALYADFRAALDARVRQAAERAGGRIPPALDARGGEDWGNLWASYPIQTYAATDPLVGRTLEHVRRDFREGIATYLDGRLLHHYLGFRVFQTELLRGEQANVVRGLYDSLAHTTATHGGFETGIPAYGSRSVDDNMTPHGWWAAEYVAFLRNMLVREADDGGVVIMSALSPSWLEPGKEVGVTGAATAAGRVTYRLVTRSGGARLTWDAQVPEGTPIRWPLPVWTRDVRAEGLAPGARTLTLPARSGSLELSWRADETDASYDGSVSRLVESYRRRSR